VTVFVTSSQLFLYCNFQTRLRKRLIVKLRDDKCGSTDTMALSHKYQLRVVTA